MKKHRVFLLTGGNIGNRLAILQKVNTLISEMAGNILSQSHIYETDPWGFTTENKFLNQALKIETDLEPEELLNICQSIELLLGRIKNNENMYRSRTIDIDILFFDSSLIDTPHLKIPHPFIQERLFVLKPLTEIAPDYVHPILRKSIFQLLVECKDISAVNLFKD